MKRTQLDIGLLDVDDEGLNIVDNTYNGIVGHIKKKTLREYLIYILHN